MHRVASTILPDGRTTMNYEVEPSQSGEAVALLIKNGCVLKSCFQVTVDKTQIVVEKFFRPGEEWPSFIPLTYR